MTTRTLYLFSEKQPHPGNAPFSGPGVETIENVARMNVVSSSKEIDIFFVSSYCMTVSLVRPVVKFGISWSRFGQSIPSESFRV